MIKKLRMMDAVILKKIKKLHNRTNNRIMAVITTLGTGGLVWFLMCIPFFFFEDQIDTALNIPFALIIAWLVGEITIKHLVGRTRPSETLPEEEQIIKRPKYYSFPSGHSASSFSVVAVMIIRSNIFIVIPVVILASLIAFSRIYLRVHYFTDVLAGIILGLVCGFASISLLDTILHNLFHIYLA